VQLDIAAQEVAGDALPIKRLLLLVDLAKQGLGEEEAHVPLVRWTQVLRDMS
jgi:hypothetical protein